jgi:hypothetical protein
MLAASTQIASSSRTSPRSLRPLTNVSPVAWTPGKDMDYADWVAAGNRLGTLGRCSQWWLGDWIRFGNAQFGERYARAARITGYDVQTLTNMVYVATRFEISRRRENLSWSHHETLAPLEPDMQDWWFDRAVAERLSVSDLRIELRSARGKKRGNTSSNRRSPPALDAGVAVICPECGYTIVASVEE